MGNATQQALIDETQAPSRREIACAMLRLYDGNPARWCQLRMFDYRQELVDGLARHACCLAGAFHLVSQRYGVQPSMVESFGRFSAELMRRCGGNVARWNDDPKRKFSDVVQLLQSIAEAA
jgi:hypothetical protein